MILLTGHSRYDSRMLICFSTKSFTLWHWKFLGAISYHPGWWNNISVLFFASLRKKESLGGFKKPCSWKRWERTLKLRLMMLVKYVSTQKFLIYTYMYIYIFVIAYLKAGHVCYFALSLPQRTSWGNPVPLLEGFM